MRTSPGAYGVLLVILGAILGWWLSDRPFNQLDDALRYKLDTIERSLDASVPLAVVVIIVLIVALLFRGK